MKRYIIFAGVNGAGKTTLYQTYKEIKDIPRVNLDEIIRKNGSWKNPLDVVNAGRIAVSLVKECISAGHTFNQETTLCGKSILRNIESAKKAGFYIEIYYVGLDTPELAIERVMQRVKNGGHGIPESDIRRRYNESFNNLLQILPSCDCVEIYDNTEYFHQVAMFEKGQCVYRTSIIPDWCKRLFNNHE